MLRHTLRPLAFLALFACTGSSPDAAPPAVLDPPARKGAAPAETSDVPPAPALDASMIAPPDADAGADGASGFDSSPSAIDELGVDRGSSATYRIGDPIAITFTPRVTGRVAIDDVDANGVVSRVFPNAYATNDEVAADVAVTYPPMGANYKLSVGGPAGTEKVRVTLQDASGSQVIAVREVAFTVTN